MLASPELMQMNVWSKAWLVSFLSMTWHINDSASGGINNIHAKLLRGLTIVWDNLLIIKYEFLLLHMLCADKVWTESCEQSNLAFGFYCINIP